MESNTKGHRKEGERGSENTIIEEREMTDDVRTSSACMFYPPVPRYNEFQQGGPLVSDMI